MGTAELATLGACAATLGAATISLGVFHPRVALFGPVIARGPRSRRAIALTFDDGPHPDFTPHVSEILLSRGARGTFFCVGREVEKHPELTLSLASAGHDVENHTFSHDTFSHLFSATRLGGDLSRCQELIKRVTGREPRYYRPAVGIRNPAVHAAARGLGLPVVTWNRAPRDGARPLTEAKVQALVAHAQPGDIFALHDGSLSGNQALRQTTLQHLPELVKGLRERGFELVTLSLLLTGEE